MRAFAPIGRSLWRRAGPTAGLMMVQILVAAVDVYYIGALVFSFQMLMMNIAMGGMGGSVTLSLACAPGSRAARRCTRSSRMVLAVAFGVVAATAIVAGVVGQSSYELVNEKLAAINEVSVPSMVAAQRIGEVGRQPLDACHRPLARQSSARCSAAACAAAWRATGTRNGEQLT